MALFGKLFEKKNCAICGKELGVFGKTKISEAYLCKDCSGKLSPYFHGYRTATVEVDLGVGAQRARHVERVDLGLVGFAVGQQIGRAHV